MAVLIAGPKITESEADRDRLDLLVEQLLEEDIVTLKEIVDVVRRRTNGVWPLGFDVRRSREDSKYRLVCDQALTGLEACVTATPSTT